MKINTTYYNSKTRNYMVLKYKVLPTVKATTIVLLLVSLHAIASTITS